jgi:hypothetical protein
MAQLSPLPVQPVGDQLAQALSEATDASPLSLTDAGAAHPLTNRLAGRLQRASEGPSPAAQATGEATPPKQAQQPGEASNGQQPEDEPKADEPNGSSQAERSVDLPSGSQWLIGAGAQQEPIMAARYAGAGKILTLRTPELWRMLNPTLLSAHDRMYVNLITWAVDGGWVGGKEGPQATGLALDQRVYLTSEPVQAWMEAQRGSQVLAEIEPQTPGAQAAPARPRRTLELQAEPTAGGDLARLVLEDLPSGVVRLRPMAAPDAPAQGPAARIDVLNDNPELRRLAQNAEFLRLIASQAGGTYGTLADLDRTLLNLPPANPREQKQEWIWRLWDSGYILALLAGLLTIEWIWRKLVGLV